MNRNRLETPLVSVVIPAYNVEARVGKTLESIIAQDYPNIEIIVVNDASTDGTAEQAQKTLKESARPSLFICQDERRGVSAARNAGLDAAKGEYVWFCDGDDIMEKNFVSTLVRLILEYNCDLSFCGMRDRFDDGRPDVDWPITIGAPYVRSGEELLRLRLFKRIVPGVWCMLFRRKFLDDNSLRFYEHCHWGEDVEFQLKAFCRADTIAFTHECLYIYMHYPAMSSLRDTDTGEKKLIKYRERTDVNFRVAEYLSEYAPSEKVKALAEDLLLPEAVIRRATLCAKTGDKAAFDALLTDRTTRKTLRRSVKFFLQKPEVFLKASALLYFPRLYYKLRAKNS